MVRPTALFTALAGCAARLPAGTDRNVTFDSSSFFIDGERQLLLSGAVHYPRVVSAIIARHKTASCCMRQCLQHRQQPNHRALYCLYMCIRRLRAAPWGVGPRLQDGQEVQRDHHTLENDD